MRVIYLFATEQLSQDEALTRAAWIETAFDAFAAPVVVTTEAAPRGGYLVVLAVRGQKLLLDQTGPPPSCLACHQSFQTWSAHHEDRDDHACQSPGSIDRDTEIGFELLIALEQQRERDGRLAVRQAAETRSGIEGARIDGSAT